MSFELSKSQMVEMILGYDTTIGNLDRQLKDLKEKRGILERRLLNLMEEHQEKSFSDDAGRTISRSDRLVVNVRKEQKNAWFDWLEEIGRPDLIKTDVNKNSLNALVRKIIKGEENHALPEFFDLSEDIFYPPKVSIKLGQKSLRKAAADADTEE